MGYNSASESWRIVRSVRSDRPADLQGPLGDGARMEVFQTGLEQSQQQFSAASAIGYESRPLNLYYGLSQAVRALAAASAVLGPHRADPNQQSWQVSGHGLKTSTTIADPRALLDLEVWPNPPGKAARDMYSRMGQILHSPLDTGPVRLAALLTQISEYYFEYGAIDDELPPVHDVRSYAGPPDAQALPYRVEAFLPTSPLDGHLTEPQVRALVNRYPALRDFDPVDGDGRVVPSHNPGGMWLLAHDQRLLRPQGGSFIPAGAVQYRNLQVVLPAAGRSGDALAPLATWTLLLYVLSMLARYAPDSWTRVLSITSSPVASKVEFLLDLALESVPELLAEALQRLNRP